MVDSLDHFDSGNPERIQEFPFQRRKSELGPMHRETAISRCVGQALTGSDLSTDVDPFPVALVVHGRPAKE